MQETGCVIQDTGYRIQNIEYRMHETGRVIQDTVNRYSVKRAKFGIV